MSGLRGPPSLQGRLVVRPVFPQLSRPRSRPREPRFQLGDSGIIETRISQIRPPGWVPLTRFRILCVLRLCRSLVVTCNHRAIASESCIIVIVNHRRTCWICICCTVPHHTAACLRLTGAWRRPVKTRNTYTAPLYGLPYNSSNTYTARTRAAPVMMLLIIYYLDENPQRCSKQRN